MPVGSAIDVVEQLPLIVREFEKQNRLLDQLGAFIASGRCIHGTDEAVACETLLGRDHASYLVGRVDAFREVLTRYQKLTGEAG